MPSIITAALLVLAFPPFDFALFAWFALVPLFLQLQHSSRLTSFWQGLLTGVLFYVGLMWWTGGVGKINLFNFFGLWLYLSLFYGLFALAAHHLLSRFINLAPLALPALWTAIEYLRSHVGFLSQSFGILGYSQYTFLPAARLAAYTGVYGVSFLVVAGNAVLFMLLRYRFPAIGGGDAAKWINWRRAGLLHGTIILLLGWFVFQGVAGEKTVSGERLIVALVQGNAVADEKFGYERYLREVLPVYERLTRGTTGANLVVWPSSSVPGILPGDRNMVERLGELSRKSHAYLLIGAAGLDKFNPEQTQQQRIANSAFLFDPSGQLRGRYDKRHLTPFDEYLPARGVIPWPAWIVNTAMTDHYPGKSLTVFETDKARFGVQICFENMFPDQVRELASKGAEFVIAQSNEFYTPAIAAHYQNLAFNVLRAIENRLPVLRSSTNGVSCIIDPMGRIIDSVRDNEGREVGVIGITKGTIPLTGERSFYTRHGDVFALACLAATLTLIAIGGFIRTSNPRNPHKRQNGGL